MLMTESMLSPLLAAEIKTLPPTDASAVLDVMTATIVVAIRLAFTESS